MSKNKKEFDMKFEQLANEVQEIFDNLDEGSKSHLKLWIRDPERYVKDVMKKDIVLNKENHKRFLTINSLISGLLGEWDEVKYYDEPYNLHWTIEWKTPRFEYNNKKLDTFLTACKLCDYLTVEASCDENVFILFRILNVYDLKN